MLISDWSSDVCSADLCSLGSGEIRRHAASLETLRHMIAAGAGYSLIPALAREDHGVLDGLVDYTALDDGVGRTVAVLWRDSEPQIGRGSGREGVCQDG